MRVYAESTNTTPILTVWMWIWMPLLPRDYVSTEIIERIACVYRMLRLIRSNAWTWKVGEKSHILIDVPARISISFAHERTHAYNRVRDKSRPEARISWPCKFQAVALRICTMHRHRHQQPFITFINWSSRCFVVSSLAATAMWSSVMSDPTTMCRCTRMSTMNYANSSQLRIGQMNNSLNI